MLQIFYFKFCIPTFFSNSWAFTWPYFWISGSVWSGFQSHDGSINHLYAFSPRCNWILRFTSGATPADFFATKILENSILFSWAFRWPNFWFSGSVWSGFQSHDGSINHLYAFSPRRNGLLRFTSSATPADFFAASMPGDTFSQYIFVTWFFRDQCQGLKRYNISRTNILYIVTFLQV